MSVAVGCRVASIHGHLNQVSVFTWRLVWLTVVRNTGAWWRYWTLPWEHSYIDWYDVMTDLRVKITSIYVILKRWRFKFVTASAWCNAFIAVTADGVNSCRRSSVHCVSLACRILNFTHRRHKIRPVNTCVYTETEVQCIACSRTESERRFWLFTNFTVFVVNVRYAFRVHTNDRIRICSLSMWVYSWLLATFFSICESQHYIVKSSAYQWWNE